MATGQPDSLETERDFMEGGKRPRGRMSRQESPESEREICKQKRKAPPNQTRNNKKAKKFSWTTERVDDLLKIHQRV